MALPLRQFEPQAPPRRQRRSPRRSGVRPDIQKAQVVEFSPRVVRSPRWLRNLKLAKNVLVAVAFLATAGSLALYVQVVNNQQEWVEQYSRLNRLRQDERELKIHGEGIDNSLRDRALNGEMVPVTTERIINVDTKPMPSSGQPTFPQAFPEEFPTGY